MTLPAQPLSWRTRSVMYACVAAAALAAFGTWRPYALSSLWTPPPADYRVEELRARLAPVIERFPREAVLGLLTDLTPDPLGRPVMVMRWVLAPRQLVFLDSRNANPEWAVGVFDQPAKLAGAGAAIGYRMTEELGHGVALYRHERP